MAGNLVLALAAWLPTGPAHPPGRLSALLSLPRRLHALTLIDKNLILPPWPYKAWFPSPESLAGPLTFLISCSCLLLWCCFGRGQGGHGEWKHLAGQTISAPCLLSLQTLALACPCYLWPFAQGGLAMGAELGRLSFSAGRSPPLHSLTLFLRAVPHTPASSFAGWCSDPQVLGDGQQGSLRKFVVQDWDAMLNLWLCHSFPGLCAVLLVVGIRTALLYLCLLWVPGLLQKCSSTGLVIGALQLSVLKPQHPCHAVASRQ